jgi:hypothetical protein
MNSATIANTDHLTARDLRVVLLVMFAALLVRVLAALVLPDQTAHLPDARSYRDMAQQLWTSWRTTHIYAMPLYSLLSGLAGLGWGQLLLDIVLSTISVGLIYWLAVILFGDRRVAVLAAVAAAVYPALVFFAVVGVSETLYIALVLAAFVAWYRKAFLLGAVFAVLAILTRPVFEMIAPVLVVYFAAVIHRLPAAAVVRNVLVYIAVYCVLMSPWWLHNYSVYGSFVRLYPAFGNALYAGNNPMNRTGGGNVGIDYDRTPFRTIADPLARQQAMRDAAIDYIVNNPGRFIELAGLKFIRMWRLWPRYESYATPGTILISVASFGPVLLLAILKLLFFSRGQYVRVGPILLLVVYTTLVHMVIQATIRYRLPLEPFLIVLAASALVDLAERLSGRSAVFGRLVAKR